MVQIALSTVLFAASVGLIAACAPGQYGYAGPYAGQAGQYGGQYAGQSGGVQESYIRQYQSMHRDNPCVQCQAIVVESECSSNWHSQEYGCSTPTVNYGLGPQSCGQASISCPSNGGQRSSMLVALVDNSDQRFADDARVYAPISQVQGASASLTQQCGQQSQWLEYSTDDYKLVQPLTIQCAHNAPGFILPPVSERYQQFMRREEAANVPPPQPAVQQSAYSAPQQSSYVAPQQSYEQTDVARVVNEDVREEILGTTLVPVVKERVIQKVIKEVHNYPIQKKRIIKTRRLSKPVVAQREIVERVPATRIVPTYEEVRRVEKVHGTTIEPIVEAFEVTEMLPAIYTPAPMVVERRPQVQSYEVQMPSNAGVQSGGYEQQQVVQAVPQQSSNGY